MKTPTALLLSAAAALLPACSNTTVVAHKTAYDINAEFAADLSKPVSANIGYESHAAIAVPPKISAGPRALLRTSMLPLGDALPTVTAVRLNRVKVSNAAGTASDYAFDYTAAAATGRAAIAATGGNPDAQASPAASTALVETAAAGKSFDDAAAEIQNNAEVIPTTPQVADPEMKVPGL